MVCEKLKEDECSLPDYIRKVFEDVEISSEQLKIILKELTSLVRHCYSIDSYFPNTIFIYRPQKNYSWKYWQTK